MATEVTVGIDIGTTSVKAVAADAEGRVVARARVPHGLRAGHAGELAHDARSAWHHGPRAALRALQGSGSAGRSGPDLVIRGVNVAAMVPSLAAVDTGGVPVSDGLLYGDDRGRGGDASSDPSTSGELVRFLTWLAGAHPEAAGYWPAQAVANRALGGAGAAAIDTVVAMTATPLFDHASWDVDVARAAGVADVDELPRIVTGQTAVGSVDAAGGAALGPGTIDALAEQMVAGADEVGDVLVILGSTLIVWAVVDEWRNVDIEPPLLDAPSGPAGRPAHPLAPAGRSGLWTVPHTAPGKALIGGPSNAGGLFVDWVKRLLYDGGRTGAPSSIDCVPVWQPYLRGERVPLHDPARRASLHDLHIGVDAGATMRAAYEASAFAVRHVLDLAELAPHRIVASGGGAHDAAWVQALADGTGLPVDVVAVPEGAALGAAFLARVTAGLEPSAATAGRWAAVNRRVEPIARHRTAVHQRYDRYRQLAQDR